MKKICIFDGCGRQHKANGYCATHYVQYKRGDELKAIKGDIKLCHVDGCDRPHSARGYCRPHYQQYRAGNGIREEITQKESNIGKTCEVGCDEPCHAKGLCKKCYMRLINYNITKEELISLDYICEVCGDTTWLHIDHDHVTGNVRGVLCQPCNTSLGKLQEDPDRIMKLADYARKWKNV
jgi:hypothetical protein